MNERLITRVDVDVNVFPDGTSLNVLVQYLRGYGHTDRQANRSKSEVKEAVLVMTASWNVRCL